MSVVSNDWRYALRQVGRQPWQSLVVVLTLGTAIGLVTALFSIFNTVMFRLWPVKDPGRMVRVTSVTPRGETGLSVAEWSHLAHHARSVSGLVANDGGGLSGAILDGRRVYYDCVSTQYFQVLRIPLALGRAFLPQENPLEQGRSEAPHGVAVISHDLWRTTFGSDPTVVGRTLAFKQSEAQDGVPLKVVGVAAPGFNGPGAFRVDLWVPLLSARYFHLGRETTLRQMSHPSVCCRVAGRLADGAMREQARAELQLLSDQFRTSLGRPRGSIRVSGTSDMTMGDRRARRDFALPFLAVGLVLLLACANAGNILLARGQARRQEVGVRLALGASRARIVRQLLTEAFVLAGAAGLLGIAIAVALARLLVSAMPHMSHLRLAPDHRVLLFVLALAVVACVTAGLAPALHATQRVNDALRGASFGLARRFALREGLLAVQVALCMVLLLPAAMLHRAMPLALTRGLDFDPDALMVSRIELSPREYDAPRRRGFVRELVAGLADARAAVAEFPPFAGVTSSFRLSTDPPDHQRSALVHQVTTGYFDLVRARLVAGRRLEPADAPDQVVVVNEALAQATWPQDVPIGRQLLLGTQWLQVVGVVRDANVADTSGITPAVYRPLQPEMLQVIVLHEEAAGVAGRVTQIVAAMDPGVRIDTKPLAASLDNRQRAVRFGLRIVASIGAIALALAAFGLFGVFAHAVEERTREIGIRMALGARAVDVFRSVFATTGRSLAYGLAAGVLTAAGGARLLRHSLHGLSALDPLAYLAVGAMLAAAAVVATYAPARRALHVDPAAALRHE
jgi:predicted permease